jgi:hypothetical protein
VVSHDAIRTRLENFVCARLGWEAMQQAKNRHGLVGTTQGNQVLLDPQGKYLEGLDPRGKRYEIKELVAELNRIHEQYPGHTGRRDDLKLEWFYVDRFAKEARGQLDGQFVSKVDRKPLVMVEGRASSLLQDQEFLRRHVRSFIWERQVADDAPRLTVWQFEPTRKELVTIDLSSASMEEVSRQLDAAWLAYMQDRPMLARGYIDNAHGKWLRAVMEEVYREEVQLRDAATAGTLLPPGRE